MKKIRKVIRDFFYEEEPKSVEFAPPIPSASKLERAYNAELMLQNPLYRDIIESLIAQYTALWQQSKNDDYEIREEYYRYLKAVKQIDAHIKAKVAEAKYEQQVEQLKEDHQADKAMV